MELFEEIQSGCEAGFCQPLISFLRAKKEGRNPPPYIPRWDLMPLHQLCQLALLWSEAGFKKEAGELAHWLLQFEKFLPLWSTDKQFNEQEGRYWFSRLSQLKSFPGEEPDFFYSLSSTSKMSSAFTLAGNGTSLGMIQAGDVEIRALGPQTETLKFGIKGRGLSGWTRCFALPEVWVDVKTKSREDECKLDLRFVGLTPEIPLYFAFYVKAQSCQIGNEILKPKSLRRYNGEASAIVFQNLKIESSVPYKIQVIPLAGEGCFWDCEFLATYEIPSCAPQINFSFNLQQ